MQETRLVRTYTDGFHTLDLVLNQVVRCTCIMYTTSRTLSQSVLRYRYMQLLPLGVAWYLTQPTTLLSVELHVARNNSCSQLTDKPTYLLTD